MDPAERLADYLANELDPDERAAFEAELARDPALRARLTAVEDADAALATLSSPSPPEGFDARLDARLDEVLAQQLGAPPAVDQDHSGEAEVAPSGSTTGPSDELGRRRRQRGAGMPRWVTAVSGAAAAVVVLAGGGLVLSNSGMFSGQDVDEMADGPQPADDNAMSMMDAIEESAERSVDGPLLTSRDRALEETDVESLLAEPDVFALADQGLTASAAASLSSPYRAAFDSPPPTISGETTMGAPESGDADDSADDSAAADGAEQPAAALRVDGEVTPEDAAAVSRCLDVLLAVEVTAVVVYAELADYDGDEVVVFGLVSEDPGTGTFSRREAWVLDRDSCNVRLFTQG